MSLNSDVREIECHACEGRGRTEDTRFDGEYGAMRVVGGEAPQICDACDGRGHVPHPSLETIGYCLDVLRSAVERADTDDADEATGALDARIVTDELLALAWAETIALGPVVPPEDPTAEVLAGIAAAVPEPAARILRALVDTLRHSIRWRMTSPYPVMAATLSDGIWLAMNSAIEWRASNLRDWDGEARYACAWAEALRLGPVVQQETA